MLHLTSAARSEYRTKRRSALRRMLDDLDQFADRVRLLHFDDANSRVFVREWSPNENYLRVYSTDALTVCKQVGEANVVFATDLYFCSSRARRSRFASS